MSTNTPGSERRHLWAGRLAWALWAVCLLLVTATMIVAYLTGTASGKCR